jgi:glycosyltransferase involved in cell wall biosynthesis
MRSWVKYYVNGSYNAQSFLKKVIPLKGERFKRIPNAPIERPVTVKAEEYRARRGIEPGQLFIGVVALLEERKGHHVFLEGLRDYVSDYEGVQNIKVIFQGHGELERKLQTMIDDYQLSDWVKIMPNEPEVMNFINAVDILALPSISHEDFPTVVIEAMSLARPVVASRLAGTPEQIDDPHTGLLLPPGEAPAWTEFFKNIDHYLWDEMGEKGRGLFNGQFAREVVLGQYERMYLSLKETAHD